MDIHEKLHHMRAIHVEVSFENNNYICGISMKNKQSKNLNLWENDLFVLYNSKTNPIEKKLSASIKVPKLLKPIHQNNIREPKFRDNFSGSKMRTNKNFKFTSTNSDNE